MNALYTSLKRKIGSFQINILRSFGDPIKIVPFLDGNRGDAGGVSVLKLNFNPPFLSAQRLKLLKLKNQKMRGLGGP